MFRVKSLNSIATSTEGADHLKMRKSATGSRLESEKCLTKKGERRHFFIRLAASAAFGRCADNYAAPQQKI